MNDEVFSTPTYRRMMERQQEELRKLHDGDIDLFVKMLAKKGNYPAEVNTPVYIGVRQEVVEQQARDHKKVQQKHVEDSYDQGFAGGLMFAAMLVIMIICVLLA